MPVFEDWLFHTALPLLAYATLFSGALTLVHHTADALFGIGAASVLLLFIGIHNAWDTVTFIATDNQGGVDEKSRDEPMSKTAALEDG